MEGKIINGHYEQGEVKFPVDAVNLSATFDTVNGLSNSVKAQLAKLNNIPCEPFNKSQLTVILKSHVQNVWHRDVKGTVPDSCVTGHQKRLEAYKAQLAALSSATDDLLAKPKKTKAPSAKPQLLFVLDVAAYEKKWQDHRAQQALIVRAMQEIGGDALSVITDGKQHSKGVTIKAIATAIKETKETTAPTANACGPVIKKLMAGGIITCLNPEIAPKQKAKTTEAAASATSAPVPAPAATAQDHKKNTPAPAATGKGKKK